MRAWVAQQLARLAMHLFTLARWVALSRPPACLHPGEWRTPVPTAADPGREHCSMCGAWVPGAR